VSPVPQTRQKSVSWAKSLKVAKAGVAKHPCYVRVTSNPGRRETEKLALENMAIYANNKKVAWD
jgi:hypothetical protein